MASDAARPGGAVAGAPSLKSGKQTGQFESYPPSASPSEGTTEDQECAESSQTPFLRGEYVGEEENRPLGPQDQPTDHKGGVCREGAAQVTQQDSKAKQPIYLPHRF